MSLSTIDGEVPPSSAFSDEELAEAMYIVNEITNDDGELRGDIYAQRAIAQALRAARSDRK